MEIKKASICRLYTHHRQLISRGASRALNFPRASRLRLVPESPGPCRRARTPPCSRASKVALRLSLRISSSPLYNSSSPHSISQSRLATPSKPRHQSGQHRRPTIPLQPPQSLHPHYKNTQWHTKAPRQPQTTHQPKPQTSASASCIPAGTLP